MITSDRFFTNMVFKVIVTSWLFSEGVFDENRARQVCCSETVQQIQNSKHVIMKCLFHYFVCTIIFDILKKILAASLLDALPLPSFCMFECNVIQISYFCCEKWCRH